MYKFTQNFQATYPPQYLSLHQFLSYFHNLLLMIFYFLSLLEIVLISRICKIGILVVQITSWAAYKNDVQSILLF